MKFILWLWIVFHRGRVPYHSWWIDCNSHEYRLEVEDVTESLEQNDRIVEQFLANDADRDTSD